MSNICCGLPLHPFVSLCIFVSVEIGDGEAKLLKKADQFTICLEEGEMSQNEQTPKKAGSVTTVYPLLWRENEVPAGTQMHNTAARLSGCRLL